MPMDGKKPVLDVGPLPLVRAENGWALQQPALSQVAAIVAHSGELRHRGDAAPVAVQLKELPQGSIVLAGTVDGQLAVVALLQIVVGPAGLERLLRPRGDLASMLAEQDMPLEFPVAVMPWMAVAQRFHFQWDLDFRQVMMRHLLTVARAYRCTAYAMRIVDRGHPRELVSAIGCHKFEAAPEGTAETVAWLHRGPGDEFYRRVGLLVQQADRGELPRSTWTGDASFRSVGGTSSE